MIHELLCKRDTWVDEPQFEHEEEEHKKNKGPLALPAESISTITSFVGKPEEEACKRDESDPNWDVKESAIPGCKRKKEQGDGKCSRERELFQRRPDGRPYCQLEQDKEDQPACHHQELEFIPRVGHPL
jgi:hypothetical protein